MNGQHYVAAKSVIRTRKILFMHFIVCSFLLCAITCAHIHTDDRWFRGLSVSNYVIVIVKQIRILKTQGPLNNWRQLPWRWVSDRLK